MLRLLLIFALLSNAQAGHFGREMPDPAGAGMNPERLARIPVRMQAFVDQGKAAGIVTLVARHGRLALLSASGFQDLETKTPMRTDTIFQIMSMTKPVTGIGIMILMEEGRLAIVDPVEKHLPGFHGKPITIQHLLTHTSGLPGAIQNSDARWERTLAEVVALEAQRPLEFEPGAQWRYSNPGIATLGRIIEVVSGKPYEAFIADRILRPLGMDDSFFFPPKEKSKRIASVYTDQDGVLKPAKGDILRAGARYPAPEGGLYSTAADMAGFYQMMLNKGTLDGRRILSPYSVELMTAVHTGDLKAGFSPGVGFGLGWAVVRQTEGTFRLNSIGAYGHGGAYRTYGWVDPAKDMVGVIMLQRTNIGGDVADEINSFMAMAAAAIER